jgi:hypothetical protein
MNSTVTRLAVGERESNASVVSEGEKVLAWPDVTDTSTHLSFQSIHI